MLKHRTWQMSLGLELLTNGSRVAWAYYGAWAGFSVGGWLGKR